MNILDKLKFIFGSLFLMANKLQAVTDQYLSTDDITTKQWFLTVMISQFKDHSPTLSEVAMLSGSSRQNVKQLALKLEEKGLLTIEKDPKDARAVRLMLTEKSLRYWENRQEKDEQFITDLFADITDNELNTLFESFNKLLKKIEELSDSIKMEV